MKRFRFSLETVHNLREARRDEEEQRLAQTAAGLQAAAEAVAEIERQRAAVEAKLAKATGPLCTAELTLHVGYLELLNQREHEARQHLAALEREREAQRQATLAATREAKVTGQLRARQHARHTAELVRAEQQLMDELAITATLRSGPEGVD
jgi:flagellar export protein FliJ